MTMYFKNVALLAKTEVTYGTDPVPTGTANAMLSKGVTIAPHLGNRATRDLARSTFGAQSEINTGPYVTVSFGIEYAGSGTAGTAPKWGPLLLACGFSETVSAGVSVTYATVSTALKPVTLYFYMDGQQHKVIGARGNVSFNLSRGQIPNVLSLRDVLKEWLDPRKEELVSRSQHRLEKIEHRLEVLEGYQIAYLNNDDLIPIS